LCPPQIASLALEADDMLSPALEAELLRNAEVFNVVLRRDEVRRLALSSPIPFPIHATYDMRSPTAMMLISDAMKTLVDTEDRVIRVIGNPVRDGGLLIEVTMMQAPLRDAMLVYGRNVLLLSAVISAITATLLFGAVQIFLVRPIKGVVSHLKGYAEAPEDARRIITPSAGVRELRDAEEALQSMQTQLTGALKQKDRLAQLGGAVAKVSHDLRNILTTLAFGRVDEPAPSLNRVNLAEIVSDVFDSERLAAGDYPLSFSEDIPATMVLRADKEQLFRAIFNLVRNARQAIMATHQPGEICLSASEDDAVWSIFVTDTGPGLPRKAQEHLFQPFQGGVRKGGTGLGLVIAADLVRGHGGRLELQKTDETGTQFAIRLPKADLALAPAAE